MIGLGTGLSQSPHVVIPVVPPATVTAADNGLSLNGTIVELGQQIGAVGNPANLLHDTEIPLDGFFLSVQDLGFKKLLLDPINDVYQLGDIDGQANHAALKIDDLNRQLTYSIGGAGNEIIFIDPVSPTYWIGDIPAIFDSTFFYMDNDGFEIDGAGNQVITAAIANDRYLFGDLNSTHSGGRIGIRGTVKQFEISNNTNDMSIAINGNVGFTGTVTPVNTITVVGGVVTNVA